MKKSLFVVLLVSFVFSEVRIVSEPDTSALEAVEYTYDVDAVDDDTSGGTLHYYLMQYRLGMTINGETGLITWNPDYFSASRSRIVIGVMKNGQRVASQEYYLNVGNSNRQLTINNSDTTIFVTDSTIFTMDIMDPDTDDIHTYSYSYTDSNFTSIEIIDSNNFKITNNYYPDLAGIDTLYLIARDSTLFLDDYHYSKQMRVIVNTKTKPEIYQVNNTTFNLILGDSSNLVLKVHDRDLDSLIFSHTSTVHSSIEIDSNNFKIKTVSNGVDTTYFKVSDGEFSDSIMIIIIVDTPVNIKGQSIPPINFVNQNYPNPFNFTTIIRYGVSKKSNVRISIFSSNGKLLESFNESKNPGHYSYCWNANDYSNGVYFYMVKIGETVQFKKMSLTK